MKTFPIWADFQNADTRGRVRLNTVGSIESLAESGVRLVDGLRIVLHDDELEADGTVGFSTEEHLWVATIDWDAIRHTGPVAPLQQHELRYSTSPSVE